MLFKMLKRFIGEVSRNHTWRANYSFSCGVRYWRSCEDVTGLHSINITYRQSDQFVIMCRDSSDKWRQKIDRLTSSAEYDFIIERVN